MKRASAFTRLLCRKDKRPLKQINVEIENFRCKEKGSDGGASGYDFDGYRRRGGQRWRGGGETSEGL